MNLDILDTDDGYRRYFMDPGLWEGYVRQVCDRHFTTSTVRIRRGLAGTYPTFIVDDRWVVKFFGRLFDGALSFETELQTSRLLDLDASIPAPALLAHGKLFADAEGWCWPYLVYSFLPGISFGQVYSLVPLNEKLALAGWLGKVVRRIHRLPLAETGLFQPTWDAYRAFLQAQHQSCVQSQRAWGSLPERLIDQIEGFLLPVEQLLDPGTAPHLIHADLTGDHLLGSLEAGRWTTLGLIDFGDAMTGDLLYELVALHLDLFQCDKRLLRAFLGAYHPGAAQCINFVLKAMTASLLHRFDVFMGVISTLKRQGREISSLEEMAALLWDLDSPGIHP